MGYVTINWCDVGVSTILLESGIPNIVVENQYLIVIPNQNGDIITGFKNSVIDPTLYWAMTIANGDPTLTKTMYIMAGLPGDTAQVILPPGFNRVSIPPGYTQSMIYVPNVGWVALVPGTLQPTPPDNGYY